MLADGVDRIDKMRDGKEQLRWSRQIRWLYGGGRWKGQDGKIVPALNENWFRVAHVQTFL